MRAEDSTIRGEYEVNATKDLSAMNRNTLPACPEKHQVPSLRFVECVALAFALACAVVATPSAYAQAYDVLHSFTGGADGDAPHVGLVRDPSGNLYGTTSAGGASNSGTVFKVDTTGAETVLYTFTGGADGKTPTGSLIRDAAGNLYGATND